MWDAAISNVDHPDALLHHLCVHVNMWEIKNAAGLLDCLGILLSSASRAQAFEQGLTDLAACQNLFVENSI
jgi:hypothetical protein